MSNKNWFKKFWRGLLTAVACCIACGITLFYVTSCSSYETPKQTLIEYDVNTGENLSNRRLLKYNIESKGTTWLDVTNINAHPYGVIFDHDFFRVNVKGNYIIHTYYEDVPAPPEVEE